MKFKIKKKQRDIVIAAVLLAAVIVGVCIRFDVFRPGYTYSGDPYVCLDAGHGADDVGATSGERYEKDDDLRLTLKIKESLEKMGVKVYLTREDDSDVTLKDRCKSANKKHCTLFISVHRNSAEDKNANGIEAWVSKKPKGDEEQLAENLVENICKLTDQQNRGIKKGFRDNTFGDYYINSDTDMPSLLLEVGFITNDKDNKAFDEKLDETAETIAKTIYDHIQK
ncbi:MAG TPA: N-acetylmuramoyl-L-alanine amidase [Ruminococcaceae bacterium]|nr:N-acetylmuramoyl-L-alanine amidase [Oscillospiraceae bacterium]